MIASVLLVREPSARISTLWLSRTADRLGRELGCDVRVATLPTPGRELRVRLRDLASDHLDLLALDARFHAIEHGGPFTIVLVASDEEASERAARQVLTRYQRLLRPTFELDPLVASLLPHHRRLFDLRKPLVRADYDHALDVWRWVLRLDPAASTPVQIAALFHDIERLQTESDERVEHLAIDYGAFKRAHAASGAALLEAMLQRLGTPADVITRASFLVREHEAPAGSDDLHLLNDADALSFFSLNAWGFVRYFGPEHTGLKVAYTLARMRSSARARVDGFLHHPAVRTFLENGDGRNACSTPIVEEHFP